MTTDEINNKIAHLAGWRNHPDHGGYIDPEGYVSTFGPPIYWQSLDAVAPLEAKLTEEQATGTDSYSSWLWHITSRDYKGGKLAGGSTFLLIRATPLQKCEALLRVHGLWPSPATREEGGRK